MKDLTALFLATVVTGAALHCAATRQIGPRVLHIAAEDCVELTQPGTTHSICATVDELMPFVESILGKRAEAAKKAAAPASSAPVCIDAGGQ